MLFLHIVAPSKRMMNTYFRMIREHFPMEEHRFLFIDQCPESERELFEYGNVGELIGDTSREKLALFCKECDVADVVIWHGLMYGGKKMLPLFVYRKLRKKSVWVMRGLDLYNWECKEKRGIKYSFINYMNRFIRKHIPYVVSILPTDEKVYRDQFGNRASCMCVPYPFSKDAFQEMDAFDNTKQRPNGKTFILVGNNAYTFNRHIMALDSIQKYSEEDINLFIPLSYGNTWYDADREYKSKVIETLEENFGEEKYEILYKLIDPEQYNKLLMNMDVALMPSNRQNALGNILRLLYIGNKVYLTKDNPMFQWFLEQGVEIFDIDDIEHMTFEEFKKLPSNNNAEWVREHFHPDNNYKEWGVLFEAIAHKICRKKEYVNNSHSLKEVEEEKISNKRKVNYLCVKRGQYLKRGSKYYDIVDVYVVGVDEFEYDVALWLKEDNQIIDKWFFHGIIDKQNQCKTIDYIQEDIVGNISEFYPDDEKAIIAVEDNLERKRIYDLLRERDCNFSRFIHPTASVCFNPNIGTGCIIYPHAIIDASVFIDVFSYVKNAVIEKKCQIGQFCNIGSYTILNEKAVLGDYVIVGNHVLIGKNVTIGNHVVIGDNVAIADNVTIRDGKIINSGESIIE